MNRALLRRHPAVHGVGMATFGAAMFEALAGGAGQVVVASVTFAIIVRWRQAGSLSWSPEFALALPVRPRVLARTQAAALFLGTAPIVVAAALAAWIRHPALFVATVAGNLLLVVAAGALWSVSFRYPRTLAMFVFVAAIAGSEERGVAVPAVVGGLALAGAWRLRGLRLDAAPTAPRARFGHTLSLAAVEWAGVFIVAAILSAFVFEPSGLSAVLAAVAGAVLYGAVVRRRLCLLRFAAPLPIARGRLFWTLLAPAYFALLLAALGCALLVGVSDEGGALQLPDAAALALFALPALVFAHARVLPRVHRETASRFLDGVLVLAPSLFYLFWPEALHAALDAVARTLTDALDSWRGAAAIAIVVAAALLDARRRFRWTEAPFR